MSSCSHNTRERLIVWLSKTVQTQSYTVDSQPAGTWVTSRNLTYVKVSLLHLLFVPAPKSLVFQLFNASHMAPFDIPHITHDMMLRFMGVNFSYVLDGTGRIPSAVGTDVKPLFLEEHDASAGSGTPAAKTPQQNKAMWEGRCTYLPS